MLEFLVDRQSGKAGKTGAKTSPDSCVSVLDVKVLQKNAARPTHDASSGGIYAVSLAPDRDAQSRSSGSAVGDSAVPPTLFLFESGSAVSWSTSGAQDHEIWRDMLLPFAIERHDPAIVEDPATMSVEPEGGSPSLGGGTTGGSGADLATEPVSVLERQDTLRFANYLSENERLWYMLACSYGLQQSARLANTENLLADELRDLKDLPASLLTSPWSKYVPGRHNRRHHELSSRLATLLKIRYRVNLVSDMLETPQIFWEDRAPEEEVYSRVMSHFDVSHRVHVINERLDYAVSMVESMRSSLHDDNSTKLEVYIILLIAAELGHAFL
jgi:uncharacterized Rmd1/YagE family protein